MLRLVRDIIAVEIADFIVVYFFEPKICATTTEHPILEPTATAMNSAVIG